MYLHNDIPQDHQKDEDLGVSYESEHISLTGPQSFIQSLEQTGKHTPTLNFKLYRGLYIITDRGCIL